MELRRKAYRTRSRIAVFMEIGASYLTQGKTRSKQPCDTAFCEAQFMFYIMRSHDAIHRLPGAPFAWESLCNSSEAIFFDGCGRTPH